MKWQIFIATCVAGLCLLGLNGCYGPAPGLNPQLTITLDQNAPYITSGGRLDITATSTPALDPTQIASVNWTATPNVGQFLTTGTKSVSTSWMAPALTSTQQSMQVTLTETVKTVQGVVSTAKVLVVVVQALPTYVFDTAKMTSLLSTFPRIAPGSSLAIQGMEAYVGALTDPIVTRQWTATSSSPGNIGAFDKSTFVTPANPVWTAPTGFAKTDPSFVVTLTVRITAESGVAGQSQLTVTVDPSLLP